MNGDKFILINQTTCDHASHQSYAQRRFDILNGFELDLTRCINCHKILKIEVKKLS